MGANHRAGIFLKWIEAFRAPRLADGRSDEQGGAWLPSNVTRGRAPRAGAALPALKPGAGLPVPQRKAIDRGRVRALVRGPACPTVCDLTNMQGVAVRNETADAVGDMKYATTH